jgi:hypothetical protein
MVTRYPRSPSCCHGVIGPARYAAISASWSDGGVSTGAADGRRRGLRQPRCRGWSARAGRSAGEGAGEGLDRIVLVYYYGNTVQTAYRGPPRRRLVLPAIEISRARPVVRRRGG